MPTENFEKKVNNVTKSVEATSILWKAVKKLLYNVVIAAFLAWGAWTYRYEVRDFILSKALESSIHDEVVKETEHFHHSQLDSLRNEIMTARRIAIKASAANLKYQGLLVRVEMLESMIEGLDKRGDYNTKAINNLVQAICEQMDAVNGCSINYYKSHTKDNWVKIKKDSYGINMLYPFDARSNCRGYYRDINTGNIIEIP
jgi:hypothetical protein